MIHFFVLTLLKLFNLHSFLNWHLSILQFQKFLIKMLIRKCWQKCRWENCWVMDAFAFWPLYLSVHEWLLRPNIDYSLVLTKKLLKRYSHSQWNLVMNTNFVLVLLLCSSIGSMWQFHIQFIYFLLASQSVPSPIMNLFQQEIWADVCSDFVSLLHWVLSLKWPCKLRSSTFKRDCHVEKVFWRCTSAQEITWAVKSYCWPKCAFGHQCFS